MLGCSVGRSMAEADFVLPWKTDDYIRGQRETALGEALAQSSAALRAHLRTQLADQM